MYRVEWRSGPAGFLRFSLDGQLQYALEAGMLHATRDVSVEGEPHGTRQRLEMPQEPMYMIINIDSSPRWGWPTHNSLYGGDCDAPCECCYDCKRLACTRCTALGAE